MKVYYGETQLNLSLVFDVAVLANLVGVPNLKVGFAGATGAVTNNHEVWGLSTPSEIFDISFDGQGGTLSSTSATCNKESGAASLTLPTVSPRPGFDLVGWYTDSTGVTQVAGPGDASFTPTAPGTIYARWVVQQTVTSNANGGAGTVNPQSSGVPTELTPNTFSRTGYRFAGWSTSPTEAVVYADKAVYPFTGKETLYALWVADASTTTTVKVGITGPTTTAPTNVKVGVAGENLVSSGSPATNLAMIALSLVLAGLLLVPSREQLGKA